MFVLSVSLGLRVFSAPKMSHGLEELVTCVSLGCSCGFIGF